MNKVEHKLWIRVSKSFKSNEQTDIIMELIKRLDEAEEHIRCLELEVGCSNENNKINAGVFIKGTRRMPLIYMKKNSGLITIPTNSGVDDKPLQSLAEPMLKRLLKKKKAAKKKRGNKKRIKW